MRKSVLDSIFLKKNEGNGLFKKKEYEEARKRYLFVIETFLSSELLGDLKQSARLAFISTCSNLTLLELTCKRFNVGVEVASKGITVLKDDLFQLEGKELDIMLKLLYRRSRCLFKTKKFEEAILDVDNCLQKQPQNKAFLILKNNCLSSLKKERKLKKRSWFGVLEKKRQGKLKMKKGNWFGDEWYDNRQKLERLEQKEWKRKQVEDEEQKKRLNILFQKKVEEERQLELESARRDNEMKLLDFSGLCRDTIVHVLSFLQMTFGKHRKDFSTKMIEFFGYFRVDRDRNPFCMFSNFKFSPDTFGIDQSIGWIPMKKCRVLNFLKNPPDMRFSWKVFPHLCFVHALEYVSVSTKILEMLKEKNCESLRRLVISKVYKNVIDENFLLALNKFKFLRVLTIRSTPSHVEFKVDEKLFENVQLNLPNLEFFSLWEVTIQEKLKFSKLVEMEFSNWRISQLNAHVPSVMKRLNLLKMNKIKNVTFRGNLTLPIIEILCEMSHLESISIGLSSNVSNRWVRLLTNPSLQSLTLFGFHTFYEEFKEEGNTWRRKMKTELQGSNVKNLSLYDIQFGEPELLQILEIPSLKEVLIVGGSFIVECLNDLPKKAEGSETKIILQDVQVKHRLQQLGIMALHSEVRPPEGYVIVWK